MRDPLREHAAYIEMLQSIRNHLSLVHVASYLGSKPQNVAGWIAAHSVPTLKDFRARLLEMAFFLKYIAEIPLELSNGAQQILDEEPPQLPPWGLTYSLGHAKPSAETQATPHDRPFDRLAQRLVTNVRELLPTANLATGGMRRPALSWQKLALLRHICDEDRPRRSAKSDGLPAKPSTVVIWGESCAGKSTFANALLGADLFPVAPVPDHPRLKALTAGDKVLVEAPSYDNSAPTQEENLALLRYLLNTEDSRLFIVMSSGAFPLLNRVAFIEQIALLPCKLNLIFTKLDLYSPADHEQVSRFLRGRFAAHRVFLCGSPYSDEVMLNELRAAAGLVGTARFKMVAAASSTARDPEDDEQMLNRITELVRRVGHLSKDPLNPDTTLKQLKLTDPQIGAILLEIEQVFHMKFPDRDADLALRGEESLRWLTNVILPLTG